MASVRSRDTGSRQPIGRRLYHLLPFTVVACSAPSGPTALLQAPEQLTPESLYAELGSPTWDSAVTSYSPPIREIGYLTLGLVVSYQMEGRIRDGRYVDLRSGQLRAIHVSRRWRNPLFGLRVGDRQSSVDAERLLSSSESCVAQLKGRPGWRLKFDCPDSSRIVELVFLNPAAPVYREILVPRLPRR